MNELDQPRTALVIYGNVQKTGFVHSALNVVSQRLEHQGMAVDRLHLAEIDMQHCNGCFHCLRHGTCVIDDDMQDVYQRIKRADALFTGASVRNGNTPALYKTFVERITYPIGFTRVLRDKHISAIGAVGMATGKKQLGQMLLLSPFYPKRVEYQFFRTGIPTRICAEDIRIRLEKMADHIFDAVQVNKKPTLSQRFMSSIDDCIMRTFMFKKNAEHTYDHVIKVWRETGAMK